MFYDLNVNWTGSIASIKPILAILEQLGYTCVALNYTVSKVKGASSPFTPGIMDELGALFPKLQILRRLTVIFDDASKNQSISSLASKFDLVAVQPQTEKALQSAATALEIDLISLDMTSRPSFYLRHKIACAAVERGVKFEVCYCQAVRSSDARRHTISNAAAIFRATRERGIILSSGISDVAAARAPLDVVNLAIVWGLNAQAARNAVELTARAVTLNGKLRQVSAKQTVLIEGQPRKKLKTE